MSYTDLLKINIADIASDDVFKISKQIYPATLAASLKLSGMLEIPYVIKTGSAYSIFTCHNRIKILRVSGVPDLICHILNEPDINIFMKNASLKAYRNELGPMGKLKTLSLLDSFFHLNESSRKDFCTKVLKLPLEIIENKDYMNKVMDLPVTLSDYIDEKDMSFKTIKDLSLLPQDWTAVIDNWIKDIPVRVNVFRMLIDYVFDIYRRGDSLTSLELISFSDDKILYDTVYRIRYPEFSKLKNKSDSIISEISEAGLTIDFPEFFDRNFVTLKLDINKKSACADQLQKISNINIEKLTSLLSLL